MKIHKNLYAGNPTYFVAIKQNGRHYYGLNMVNIGDKWYIRTVSYAACDIRSDKFSIVGEIDLYKVIENAVLGAVKE